MAVIKLNEPYAITQLRKDVRDALTLTGEMCIALEMFHPSNDPDVPRCQSCYNAVYKQGKEYDCPDCYGTTFEGGIKVISRILAVFTQDDNDEPITNHGVWNSNQRMMQCEAFPLLSQRDYVVRVSRWGAGYIPLAVEGIWAVGPVKVTTLRTGTRWDDQNYASVGQVAQMSLMPSNHPIYRLPIIGKSFAESPAAALGELPPVETPDTKVVYFPISGPATETPPSTPIFTSDGFTWIQHDAADTWVISNPLGRTPAACTVYIDGEVVEVDEEYPDANTVVLHFGTAVAGRAEFI